MSHAQFARFSYHLKKKNMHMYSFSFFVVQDQGCKEKKRVQKRRKRKKQVSNRQLLTFELFYLFLCCLCVCVCVFFSSFKLRSALRGERGGTHPDLPCFTEQARTWYFRTRKKLEKHVASPAHKLDAGKGKKKTRSNPWRKTEKKKTALCISAGERRRKTIKNGGRDVERSLVVEKKKSLVALLPTEEKFARAKKKNLIIKSK